MLKSFNAGPSEALAPKQMSFSVVSLPDKLEFVFGVKADKLAAIKIEPTSQAKEQVSFYLKDILHNGKSVMSQGVVRAGFAPAILEPKDFSKGAGLIVSSTKNAQKGEYTIVCSIKTASAIEKEFTFPVRVK